MSYYISGIVLIIIAIILQISTAPFMQIYCVVPNFLVIAVISFNLGLFPKYKRRISCPRQTRRGGNPTATNKGTSNVLQGIVSGFVAGLSQGINSRLFLADIFSWTITGFLMGLISGVINRESIIVKSLLLFSFTFLQGIFSSLPLYVLSLAPSPLSFFLRLLFSSFYTTVLGTFFFWITTKKEEGVIEVNDSK